MNWLFWIIVAALVASVPIALLGGRFIYVGTRHLDARGGPPVIGRDARVEGVRDGEL